MLIRGKTKHRLLILLAAVSLLAAAGGTLYVVRSRQIAADLLRSRDAGLAALAEADYHAALHQIGRYIQRHPSDIDALYAYAQARQNVPLQGGAHLVDAAGVYRRILDLQPGHVEAGHRLLGLYLELGYSTETLALAEQALARNSRDIEALRAKAVALARSRKFAEAWAAARMHNELAPLDVEFQFATLQIMRQAGENDAKLLAYTQALRGAYPDDPRPELVQACVCMMTGDKGAALEWAHRAAARPMTDPEVIARTVGLLDNMGQFSEAMAVLERVVGLNREPFATGLLVERWWQLRQWQKIVNYLAPTGAAGPSADSRVAAMHATALLELGRRPEAQAILASLALRHDDAEAAGWADLIPVAFGGGSPEAQRMYTACNDAIMRVPASPYFRFLLGRAAERMGERELALEYWRRASELAPSWPAPFVERSRLLLQLGRAKEAVLAAQEARRRSPNDAETLTAQVLAGVQAADAIAPEALAPLGELLDEVQRTAPGHEPGISARIALLARSGQKDLAAQAAMQALVKQPALSQETLLAIAAISESAGLGQEDACYERCRGVYGWTAELALAQARTCQRRGQAQEGLALFSASQLRSGEALDWKLAEARYRDEIGDPEAKQLWMTLAEENAGNTRVQWGAAGARCLAGNREFRDRVLARLQEQIGSQGVAWRLERARWLLESQPTEKQVVEAAALLSDATRIAPEELPPHYLLAQCMERLNNPTVAIEQLTIVTEKDKDHHDAALRLARLLHARGETVRARAYVDRILQSGALPASTLRQVAAVLADLDDADRAAQVIETLRQAKASSKESDLLLARIYQQRKQLDKAEGLLDTLLQGKDPNAIQFAIAFYLAQNRPADAEKALAQLDQAGADPAVAAAIRGDFYARTGRSEQALAVYQSAVSASPGSPVIWRALVLYHLSLNNIEAALAAADRAGSAATQDEALATLRKEREAISGLADEPMLPALLVSALGSAEQAGPAYETIGLLERARKAGESPAQTLQRLRPLGDRNPRLLPLQLILVRTCLAAGKYADAVVVANRTAQLFPEAPEPARAAAVSLAAAGRWAEALTAAQRWRRLAPEQGADADAAIAGAYLGLGQVDNALQSIKPYLEPAWTAPDTQGRWILLWSQAQLRAKRTAPVEQSLLPLIRMSAQWRGTWMRLAIEQVASEVAAEQWLHTVAQYIPADALDERISLAGAWQQFADRTKKVPHQEQAKKVTAAVAKDVQGTHGVSGQQVQYLATLCESQGDRAAARTLFRQALQIDPQLGVSMNNLATILAEEGADLAEAEALAAAAVRANPDVAAFQDTLAAIRVRRGQFGPAVDNLNRAVELQPDNCVYRIRLAGALLGSGQDDKARQVLDRVEKLRPDAMPLPERDREQLKVLRSRFAVASAR